MSETVFYNAKNIVGIGSVGIGTTSPSAPLMVYNASSTSNDPQTSHLYVYNPTNSAGQNAIISVRNGGSSAANAYVSFDVAGSHGFSIGTGGGAQRLSFRTSWDYRGTEAMSILYANGNVGIGSTNPGYTLDVNGSANSTSYNRATASTTAAFYAPGTGLSSGSYNYVIGGGNNTGDKFVVFVNGSTRTVDGGASNVTVRNDGGSLILGNGSYPTIIYGNVGVGTPSPGATLDVTGSLRSSGAVVFSQSTTSPTCVIGASAGGNNGQTGILQVVGVASSYLAIGTSMNATTGQTHIQFNNPNGVVGSITTNGTTTAYNTGSDYRLKSNIVPMTDGLEVINKLDPVYFTFNNDPSEVCSGFIAHVLQEVIPNAVSGEKDAMNNDGSIKPQGVDSSFIVSFLVSAVQELSAKNTDLEQSLATATANVGSLETKLQTAQNDIDLLESRLAAIEALIGTNTSADTGTTSTTTRAEALLGQV